MDAYSPQSRMSILGCNRVIANTDHEDAFSEEDAAVAQAIRELSDTRPNGLDYVEARDFIAFLCTQG